MLAFTVWGFIYEGGKYFDFNQDIIAESPLDATDKALKQNSNLVVSNVCRSISGIFVYY